MEGKVVPFRSGGGGVAYESPISHISAATNQLAANANDASWASKTVDEVDSAIDEVIEVYRTLGVEFDRGDQPRRKQGVRMATEREVTNAKLEAVEARVEARLVGIEGKIDRLLDRVEASVDAAKEAKGEATLAKAAAGNTKWNILFTGLAVAALVFTLFQVYTASIDNMTGLISSLTGASKPSQSQQDTEAKTQQ